MGHRAIDIRMQERWKPFRVAERADRMRSIGIPEGVGDRIRAVAFAELQARDGFLWGLDRFPEALPELRAYWREFAAMEELHAQLLLDRAAELNVDLSERAVSDTLMRMFVRSDSADLFLYQISTAEERGMEVGTAMIRPIREVDPVSAAVFQRIVDDEVGHVSTARRFLGELDVLALRARAQSLAASSSAGAHA